MNENGDTLCEWMERQYRFSAAAMLSAISATHLVKERPSLGQIIRPARGSVLASPEIASYDPNPDYFFHWLRDSAIVIDALRVLIAERTLGLEAASYIADFVRFSLELCRLEGRALLSHGGFRQKMDPAFLGNVRSDEELDQIVGDRVLGEVRYNADGTLDLLKWSRPQNDGPALRALALLRLWRLEAFRDHLGGASFRALLEYDLDYTLRHWREPCFDLWEEISAHHYHTRIVQHGALADGAAWMESAGDGARARNYRLAAQELREHLDDHFDPAEGVYLSFIANAEQSTSISPARRLDIAVPLGVIHSQRREGPHSVLDPRAFATLARLEQLFAKEYAINHLRGSDCAPAMGRYAGDVYYSGGAYYFSTLGAAEYYFRFAEAVGAGAVIAVSVENRFLLADMLAAPPEALAGAAVPSHLRQRLFQALFDRGDMFLAMVRKYTPRSGELSEQFDRTNGAQTSAKNLAWSYAAFITAFCRRQAAERLRRSTQM
jgi:glucoamylase